MLMATRGADSNGLWSLSSSFSISSVENGMPRARTFDAASRTVLRAQKRAKLSSCSRSIDSRVTV